MTFWFFGDLFETFWTFFFFFYLLETLGGRFFTFLDFLGLFWKNLKTNFFHLIFFVLFGDFFELF